MSRKSRLTAPRRKSPWGVAINKYCRGTALMLTLVFNASAEPVNLIYHHQSSIGDTQGSCHL